MLTFIYSLKGTASLSSFHQHQDFLKFYQKQESSSIANSSYAPAPVVFTLIQNLRIYHLLYCHESSFPVLSKTQYSEQAALLHNSILSTAKQLLRGSSDSPTMKWLKLKELWEKSLYFSYHWAWCLVVSLYRLYLLNIPSSLVSQRYQVI